MKLLSMNTAGLNNQIKLHRVLRICRQFNICLLQETKITEQQTQFLKAKWGNEHVYVASPGTSRRGVITLFGGGLNFQMLFSHSDRLGQFHICLINVFSINLLIINVYGDPDTDASSHATFQRLTDKVEYIMDNFNVNETVMGGDFNLTLRPEDSRSTTRKPRAQAQLTTMINILDVFDVAPLIQHSPRYTWFRANMEQACCARYDRWYVSEGLLNGISYKTLHRTGDHSPIMIEIIKTRGYGTWKLKEEYVGKEWFCKKVESVIRDSLSQFAEGGGQLNQLQNRIDFEEHPAALVLSTVVKDLRDMAIKETKEAMERARKKEKEAMKKLMDSRSRLANHPDSVEALEEYEKARSELHLIHIGMHSRALEKNYLNFSTQGERCSRYYFNRCRTGYAAREIPRLNIQRDGGTHAIEGEELSDWMFRKYAKILAVDNNAGTRSINDYLGPQLCDMVEKCPAEYVQSLCRPVTSAELEKVVNKLKIHSAPGPLGLPNRLIKFIFPLIKEILSSFANKLLFDDSPVFPPWFFHRCIIFVLKPGKPTHDEDSYRGLSMLEGLFKIISKMLVERLKEPLKQLQSDNQFGFTIGRGIMEATRSVMDVVQNAHRNQRPLVLLSSDFFKAFDTVSIEHIKNCLQFYEFPEKYIVAFIRMMQNGTATLEINGEMSPDVGVKTGTGQGDPKSSDAFKIGVMPLQFFLDNSVLVPRFRPYEDYECPSIFFADDGTLGLDGNKVDEILMTVRFIEDFYKVSGLKLNRSKCTFMTVGCSQANIDRLINESGMQHVRVMKILGVKINEQGEAPYEHNIAPIQDKMNQVANSFNSTLATPLGRSVYAKYLLSSRYIHRIQNSVYTEEQLCGLKEAVLNLTWTRARPREDSFSKRVHISNKIVSQPLYYGGLSIPDPMIQSTALRFSWVRRFKCKDRMVWRILLEKLLSEVGRPDIDTHMYLGPIEWERTSTKLINLSQYWAQVFSDIATVIKHVHEIKQEWTVIPLMGYENSPLVNDISALRWNNPVMRRLFLNGLRNIGQLYQVDPQGIIIADRIKSFQQIENDFQVTIPVHLRNSISTLVRNIRNRFRAVIDINTTHQVMDTSLLSFTRTGMNGCRKVSSLLLETIRSSWQWGSCPKSYSSYLSEGIVSIEASQFAKELAKTRSNSLHPSIQWSSITIFLRTFWTKKKEANTRRGAAANVDVLCSNCANVEESTSHYFYDCVTANRVWMELVQKINEAGNNCGHGNIGLFLSKDLVLFNFVNNNNIACILRQDIIELIMILKHVLVKIKYRDNPQYLPTIRFISLMFCLELEKILKVREKEEKDIRFVGEVLNLFNARVGRV